MTQLSYENDDKNLIPLFTQRGYKTKLNLYVNGKAISSEQCSMAQPQQTLLEFLRDILGLTGSKLGCAEGGCGACTVMVSNYDFESDSIRHYAVNACLMPVCTLHNCHITTVEGVGSTKSNAGLHPIQERMVAFHGSQCGFCTPGIIVALYALFASGKDSIADIDEHFDGNLCRCTGYRPIWDAAKSLCSDATDTFKDHNCTTPPSSSSCANCPSKSKCDSNTGNENGIPHDHDNDLPNREQCNNHNKNNNMVTSSTADKVLEEAYQNRLNDNNKFNSQAEDMFPDELLSSLLQNTKTKHQRQQQQQDPLMIVGKSCTWFQPTSLKGLLELLDEFPDGKLVVGNTEVGIETKFKHATYQRFITPIAISELYSVKTTSTSMIIGACTSLSSILFYCDNLLSSNETNKSTIIDTLLLKTARAIRDMLRWFASTQIRNTACLGGNLATGSPISDMNPLLASMNATLHLSTKGKSRKANVRHFFKGYRRVDLRQGEIIQCIEIPIDKDKKQECLLSYVYPFKQARRREDDISIVTAGMSISITPNPGNQSNFIIADASFAYGGMGPTTVLADQTTKMLIGKPWNSTTFDQARKDLGRELSLQDNVPGGQVEYRRALAASFLFQFYLKVSLDLQTDVELLRELLQQHQPPTVNMDGWSLPLPPPPLIDSVDKSGSVTFLNSPKAPIFGMQTYPSPRVIPGLEADPAAAPSSASPKMNMSKAATSSAGLPATHASGALHCTGEAIYVDDIPHVSNMLHSALILSSKANCNLVSLDKSPALDMEGVVAVLSYDDLVQISGKNELGPIMKDEEVFATKEIRHVGMVLGIVVAESLEVANKASRAVVATYQDNTNNTQKTIVSIQDAIAANSYYESSRHVLDNTTDGTTINDQLSESSSDPNSILVSGEFYVGGQEHFYLECNSTLVIPTETGLEVFASTQSPSKTQTYCASATNTPASRVVVRTKRMGGGFGGKETRNVFSSAAAAVAAKITNRPVRLTLDRNVDMQITGQRHAFYAKYTASATLINNNTLLKLGSLKVNLYSNAGCSFDLSGPVMDRALFHIDGVYKWKSIRAEGVCCKTHQPPHTAFRGFGGPQGIAVCEHIIDELYHHAMYHHQNVDFSSIDTFRRNNMHQEGDVTHFGMPISPPKWNVPTAWDQLYQTASIPQQRASIHKFNSTHKHKKRGLAFLPTKFGIAFTAKFMNQGGALVHLYTDGTILVSHGGTEMGQGLHTKVAQITAHAFNVPLADVHVEETATDKVANTMPTAASMSTDMYGMAALDACKRILANIAPVRNKLGVHATLAEVASAAHFERIDLTAHGFHTVSNDRCGYDWDSPSGGAENRGQPFNYFTQGVAVSIVEIDVLTGNFHTLRSDILVDCGSSINPMIDIGQIEGAFIQGMGWSTTEEMIWADPINHSWITPPGRLFTSGPGTYKIPSPNDTPEVFHVKLMDSCNPFAVHSSKAIGEPPFFLGCSVFFAIKDAVRAARVQNLGKNADFEFRLPATSERIRIMCGDVIAQEAVCPPPPVVLEKDTQQQLSEEERKQKMAAFQPKGTY